ncbi:hypothetical protein F2P79_009118 [Pimephales promelas]|nr:hypothetical protein F2P79_009118 [Pimephales promelas]
MKSQMWFTSSYVLLRALLEGSNDIGDRTEREEMLRSLRTKSLQSQPRSLFLVSRHIKAGTELTWDYNYEKCSCATILEDHRKNILVPIVSKYLISKLSVYLYVVTNNSIRQSHSVLEDCYRTCIQSKVPSCFSVWQPQPTVADASIKCMLLCLQEVVTIDLHYILTDKNGLT